MSAELSLSDPAKGQKLAEPAPVELICLAAPWRKREACTARRAAAAALAEGGRPNGQMTLVLAGSRKLAELNRRFAGKNAPTDILAFPADPDMVAQGAAQGHLGDVILARPVLLRQARLAGVPLLAHLAHLAAHGALHLLGYDHHTAAAARRMANLERRALARLGFPAPLSPEAFAAAEENPEKEAVSA